MDDEILNQREIAQELGVSINTVAIAIDRLEGRREISRVQKPSDRRFSGYRRSDLPKIQAEIAAITGYKK